MQAKYYVTLTQMQSLVQLKRANKLTKSVLNKYANRPEGKINVLFTRACTASCFFIYQAQD